MKRHVSTLVSLSVFAVGTASAQQSVSLGGWATPSSVNAAVIVPLGGPFALEAGALMTYQGRAGLFAFVEATASVPVAEDFPVNVTPFYGADLGVTMKFSPNEASLSGSAFIGARFPLNDNWSWHFLTGPSVTLLPKQSITFGGAAEIGASYKF